MNQMTKAEWDAVLSHTNDVRDIVKNFKKARKMTLTSPDGTEQVIISIPANMVAYANIECRPDTLCSGFEPDTVYSIDEYIEELVSHFLAEDFNVSLDS